MKQLYRENYKKTVQSFFIPNERKGYQYSKTVLMTLLIACLTVSLLQAQNYSQIVKAVAADRGVDDFFGISVAISGNYAVVGAYQEDEDASGGNTFSTSGSAYVFKKDQGGTDNWGQIKKIVAADRGANDRFGVSVAISGDYIIVGADYDANDASGGNNLFSAGSAYIFKKDEGGTDNWGQVKKIVAADRADSDNFGYSVSISGDYIIVGASGDDEDASGANTLNLAGSAYIFKKDQGGADNWGQVKKIVAADRAAEDYFGYQVAISGDYVVIGAYQEDEDASGGNNLFSAGSAYIFKKDEGGTDNWGQVKKIVPIDRGSGDGFGERVSISGDYIIVGTHWKPDDAAGGNILSLAGAAYVFKKDLGGADNWGQVKKIVPTDRGANDRFGYSVAISGEYALVGAYTEDEDASGGNTLADAGSAYIFKYSNTTNTKPINEAVILSIYPNPVSDRLYIETTTIFETAVIYNALGQVVKQLSITNASFSINTSDFPKGVYTMQLRKTNGEKIVRQFVK